LTDEQVNKFSERAAEEGLKLKVGEIQAEGRYQNTTRDTDQFVETAKRLNNQTSDFEMHGDFHSASGQTSVHVSKRGSWLTLVIAIVIALVLLLIFVSRH
jgi:hypothetical protein